MQNSHFISSLYVCLPRKERRAPRPLAAAVPPGWPHGCCRCKLLCLEEFVCQFL